jgi:Ca2+-transporting ATPase
LESEDLHAILAAVGEGRVVQDNLRRALRYLAATNFSEVVLSVGAAAFGRRDPFTPLQLLWINLLTDTLPALALALEPANGDVLARAPAPPDAPLLDAQARGVLLRDGLALAGLGAVALAAGGPPLVFSLFGGAELGYAMRCRAPGSGPPNAAFWGWLGAGAALHLAALTVPPVRVMLGLPRTLTALELAGFAGGLILPWATSARGRDEIIVRRPAHARASQPIARERMMRGGAREAHASVRAASPAGRAGRQTGGGRIA